MRAGRPHEDLPGAAPLAPGAGIPAFTLGNLFVLRQLPEPPRKIREIAALPEQGAPDAGRPALPLPATVVSLTRALGLNVKRIVIDAGHGGYDEGSVGPHGLREKDVVLDVALRTARLVRRLMGIEVVLTRGDDRYIPLERRTAIANEHGADLFLSIHANSSPAPATSGPETYFLNFMSNPGALDVAARENAGSGKSIASLRDLLHEITLNDKVVESETFARSLQASIFDETAQSGAAVHDRGTKRAAFIVLIGASMPSALAEIGFVTNWRDEYNLSRPEFRQKIAVALCDGIWRYSDSLSQAPVAPKAKRRAKHRQLARNLSAAPGAGVIN